jgi:hypothetical protein
VDIGKNQKNTQKEHRQKKQSRDARDALDKRSNHGMLSFFQKVCTSAAAAHQMTTKAMFSSLF